MPSIAKIRLTNVIFEGGAKRFNDLTFQFDGHNGAILLENGGGKTVFVQAALQVILPHTDLAERKIRDTLSLEGGPCHLAIEWILNESPRRYGLTAVSLFLTPRGQLDSYRYVYEYGVQDHHQIEHLPFVKTTVEGKKRPASRGEIRDYYQSMQSNHMAAHTFERIKDYHQYIEENFQILPSQWRNIALINGTEGGVEDFFEGCRTTGQLVDQLLIPVVEEAMAGKGTADFVETFQHQREHFKKHKQLRVRIEESRQIEASLNQYVALFKEMHDVQKQLVAQKQLTKSVWNYWQHEKTTLAHQLEELQASLDAWQKDEIEYGRKEASFRLAQLQKKADEARHHYEQIELAYAQLETSLNTKEKSLQNLSIAELKLKIKEDAEKIILYEEQLSALAADRETQELQQLFAKNTSFLKGYFAKEEKRLQETIANLTDKQVKQATILVQQNEKLSRLCQELSILNDNRVQTETNYQRTVQDMDEIAKEILANPLLEKVEEEQPRWKTRIVALEQQEASYREILRQLADEEQQLEEDLTLLHQELSTLRQTNTLTAQQLAELHQEQDALLLRLQALRKDWYYFPSLYQKQATILDYLTEKVEYGRRQKTELLQEERFAYRLIDDYGSQHYFAAEPSLDKLIQRWSPQFNLLEAGSCYLEKASQTLNIGLDQLYSQYPLWPLTLITSTDEMTRLIDRVEQQANQLSFPVLLLTEEEARQIIQERREITERYVFPASWGPNMAAARFSQWKQQLTRLSQEATAKREAKEKEMGFYGKLLDDVTDFFADYPYESYLALQQQQQQLQDQLQKTEHLLSKKETKLAQIRQDTKQYTNSSTELKQEAILLSTKLQRAQVYFQKQKQKEKETLDLQLIKEQFQTKTAEASRQEQVVTQGENVLTELQNHLRQVEDELSRLEKDPLYREVYQALPRDSELTRKSLEEARQQLRDALNQKQTDREVIETKLNSCINTKTENKKRLDRMRNQARFPLDETLAFPAYGEQELENLATAIQELRENLDQLYPTYQQRKSYFEKCHQEHEIRTQDFLTVYEETFVFTDPLEKVQLVLAKEKKALEETKNYLSTREKQLLQETEEINHALQELRAKNERYDFLLDTIAETALPPSMLPELPYQRMVTVNRLVADLEKLSDLLKKEQDKLDRQKTIFIQFCEHKVLDIRLREMVVNGVRTKDEYEEVMDWQRNLQGRVARTIEIAEQDLREHDKELQQFIHYLHTHVATLAQELRLIPKNTRLKVDGIWKEVFSFDVPLWEEEEGKESLRKYVDWMLAQLESNQFLNDQGLEDQGLVRKSIEKWLQSKQLLQNVLKGRPIRVRCRKVTHDGKISSSLFSWETSNVWSGGEKWSKNMALFLGILNFVAEKKYHLDLKQKRQRTVIMDNPFGKASSDHVLFPVFFIAEQLGFQFIALTAHAEGKFIRDYFPVVYSCKLRPTKDQQGAVVTAEKSISHAFFRDHDPQALIRLEELEQLSLISW